MSLDACLVVTVFFPWKLATIHAAPPATRRGATPLTLTATHQALEAVHRVLAAQSVARAVLEVLVLVGALTGGAIGLVPWLTGRTIRGRFPVVTAVVTLAATAAACWAVPAFQPVTALTVHIAAVSAPAAYAAFSLALFAVGAAVVVSRHHLVTSYP
ncbi:MAG: hypothetical protein ACYDHU_07970 [Acidimicrobiales bacterium]